jgi:methyl-accepting chemotaxis protein
MQALANLSIRWKLILMLALPILGLTTFAVLNFSAQTKIASEMKIVNEMASFSITIGNLVHETQKERGLTAGFLGGNGTEFRNELNNQRANVDDREQQLVKSLGELKALSANQDLRADIASVQNQLSSLGDIRRQVDEKSIDAKSAVGHYTSLNTDLLDIIGRIGALTTDGEIKGQASAYLAFLLAKERAGIERAVLANTFAADQFGPGMNTFFRSLVTEQEAFLNVFRLAAAPEILNRFLAKMDDPAIQETERLRAIALANESTGNFGISASHWFGAQTKKINLLKEMEDSLSSELLATATNLKAHASAAVRNVAISVLLIFAITIVVVYLVATRILGPLKLATELAYAVSQGDLDEDISIYQQDEIGQLADAFRSLLENLRNKAEAANQIASGNLDVEINVASQSDTLGKSMVEMREQINSLIAETGQLIEATKNGKLDVRGHEDKFEGAWSELIAGINELVAAFVQPIQVTSGYVDRISKGDIPELITDDYKGDFNHIKNNLNQCINVMNGLIAETGQLVEFSKAGKLETRGDASKFTGGWADLVAGINDILDAVVRPIQEAQSVLETMADGDLSQHMSGDYAGDFAKIKNALNGSLESLSGILGHVTVAVDQVSTGSREVSGASQSLSQGAMEQASALEEVSASMTQVGAQTKQNADNATHASQLSQSAKKSANAGNEFMDQLLEAMKEINGKSAEVQKIITVIEEIAFQTNLLALNAAVEAARAGVHGKGFAVVAEEVRSLAQRSAKAANETTALIEDNVKAVNNGSSISDKTAEALQEILTVSVQVTDLVNDIEAASNEQTIAVQQIDDSLIQIDRVTQANTASAEQSAAAAEELSGQSESLKEMVSRFTLRGKRSHSTRQTIPVELQQAYSTEIAQQEQSLAFALDTPSPRHSNGHNL